MQQPTEVTRSLWLTQQAAGTCAPERSWQHVNLYDNVYGDFGSAAEAAVRQETYGEDIGQSSWMTVAEWRRFADQLQVGADSHVLEVGSGSGGPAVYLAAATGCQITGVDINERGIRNGERLAAQRGIADRVRFQRVDAGQSLPFLDATLHRRRLERRDLPSPESPGRAARLAPSR